MNILVTGGAGFIGSAFIRMLAAETDWRVVNLDKLTYAGNLENLASIAEGSRYRFVQGDICDERLVLDLMAEEKPDAIVHFAAESHVDRSILSPEPVVRTNLNGTFVLLEAARRSRTPRFVHVSTDEVYGSLEAPREATEDFQLNPLMIANAIEEKPLPVYGDGLQVRDWLHVEDHCLGIRAVLEQGREGEIYNIGGSRSLPNLEVVQRILQ